MTRVAIEPELVRWARERAGRSVDDFRGNLQRVAEWERGVVQPTMKQLQAFAKATHVPFGYLFLPEPPEERLPIPDLRTIRNEAIAHPSPDLLDTIRTMERRQAWLREDRLECDAQPLAFVGSARVSEDPVGVGQEMRRMLGLADGWGATVRTWHHAVGALRRAVENLGVMAVINGVVGNDTSRRLDVEEFRGFALSDDQAPLIFVNGADAKSAQMFTIAHELAHIWLGRSALTDARLRIVSRHRVESWCDQAAAELLVPGRVLESIWSDAQRDRSPFDLVARHFKVSPVVAGRRAMDRGLVDRATFFSFYDASVARERSRGGAPGGDFYRNQNTRVGELFATQVVRAAKEGRLSFKEAYGLTGLRGGAFQEYAARLGQDLP